MAWLVCKAAYGRVLKNKKEIEEHFEADKDFLVLGINCIGGGNYINKSGCWEYTHSTGEKVKLEVRYGNDSSNLHVVGN